MMQHKYSKTYYENCWKYECLSKKDSIPFYAYRAASTNKLELSVPFSGWDPIFDSLEFNAYLIELHNCTLNIEWRIVDYVFPSPLYACIDERGGIDIDFFFLFNCLIVACYWYLSSMSRLFWLHN